MVDKILAPAGIFAIESDEEINRRRVREVLSRNEENDNSFGSILIVLLVLSLFF